MTDIPPTVKQCISLFEDFDIDQIVTLIHPQVKSELTELIVNHDVDTAIWTDLDIPENASVEELLRSAFDLFCRQDFEDREYELVAAAKESSEVLHVILRMPDSPGYLTESWVETLSFKSHNSDWALLLPTYVIANLSSYIPDLN